MTPFRDAICTAQVLLHAAARDAAAAFWSREESPDDHHSKNAIKTLREAAAALGFNLTPAAQGGKIETDNSVGSE